jgi:hypothetical protein
MQRMSGQQLIRATALAHQFRGTKHIGSNVPLLLFALVSLFLAGCSSIPAGKFRTLHSSGEELLADAIGTFSNIESLQRHYCIVIAPDAPLAPDSFEPAVVAGRSTDIVPELQFREHAIRTLVSYLAVLEAFSAKDYVSAVDNASVELAGSLQNLEASSRRISSKESKESTRMFATVVDVIAREIIRERRLSALRQVMQSVQGDIDTLCTLIASDSERITEDIDLMTGRIVAHANPDRPPYGTAARLAFDEGIAAQTWQAKAAKNSLNAISKAVLEIPAAHRDIAGYLEKKSSNAEGLKSLAQELDRANLFYRGLK